MPFESLSERIQMSLRRVTGRGKLSEKDIDEMMREIRLSLLEADVNYKVVKKFTAEVKEKALGEKIMKSLSPGDMVVKVVHDELKSLMGEEATPVVYKAGGLTTFMLVGLQGAGKTTHCGKIATFLRKKDQRKPIMIAADIYRPAAIDQLVTVGKQLNIPVFSMGTEHKVVDIVREGLKYAKDNGFDLAIIDTAGRLHIDNLLMNELDEIVKISEPEEILLTIDAMMGQDAINVITTFNEKLSLTGCILTKLDGDTRGGAALSIRYLTNVPIKYIGVGEKLDQLEIFHPDRMAGRILGMGDVVSLVEKASDAVSEEEATKLAEKMQKGKFDYDDFLKQIKWIRKMGSIKGLLGMIPGVGKQIKGLDIDEKQFAYIEAIIKSMTVNERKNPQLLAKSSSRRERISKGSGRPYPEVNALTKRFEDMKRQMQMVSNMGEDDIKKQTLKKNNFNASQTKPKKGKGKGRGNFRF
ncbi:MAG: signal recognition particle protein [Bacilli bacterium]|jgi:signal recognition particle subunit SRP54|nr:signal recognition particle protein [Bacilli bacterium]MDD2681421.1 signal recognition particle protein [Bacilli bacterium]MDD3121204.1 signal recognition particle protein [Bacilli bacterium]MDD4062845.1 signal recognition particle protein [Bacilli bacterium]MDD4481896.1 signal recognition particle protein [Bacilli bacterium]